MSNTETIMRVHTDTYPQTDHGYSWTETIWFERDGQRISPTIPGAAYCARLIHWPGDFVRIVTIDDETRHYCGEGVRSKIVKSEQSHDGFWRVLPLSVQRIE